MGTGGSTWGVRRRTYEEKDGNTCNGKGMTPGKRVAIVKNRGKGGGKGGDGKNKGCERGKKKGAQGTETRNRQKKGAKKSGARQKNCQKSRYGTVQKGVGERTWGGR